MDYNSFIEEIKLHVERSMGEQYDVEVHQVTKNNGVELKGLLIFKKGKKDVSPTIYLEPFYRKYIEEFTMDEIVEEIIGVYKEALSLDSDISLPDMSFEVAKDAIVYRLVGYVKNSEILNKVPHIRFLDLAITFHYLYSSTPEGVRSFRISNSMFNKWNVSVKELYRIANRNTQKMFPIVLRSMDDVVGDLSKGTYGTYQSNEEATSEDVVYEWMQVNGNKYKNFIVMTNASAINGATSMIYPGVLGAIAKEWDSDVYVLPSSVHEVILTPYSGYPSDYLNQMVCEINRMELPMEEVLSDHVYLYKRETNSFEY